MRFEWNVLNPDLPNARAILQRSVETCLSDIDTNDFTIYQDQILIHTSDAEHHLKVVENVLNCLSSFNWKLDVEQTIFLCRSINFLGKELGETSKFVESKPARPI